MALILIMLSLILGLSLGLWLVDSVPPPVYTYLTVVFLVALDGLLFTYQHLQRGEGIWARLAQRIALQLAYGGFIIFFGAKAGRDLLLLAVIPLGFNVFANFVQFIPREAGDVVIIPRDGVRFSRVGTPPAETIISNESLPLPAEVVASPANIVEVEALHHTPVSLPSITTITVATVPAVAVEEPPSATVGSGNGVHG